MSAADRWRNMRIDMGDGESIPTCLEAVRLGDWIRDGQHQGVSGRVEGVGILCGQTGFLVRLWWGERGFIPRDDAQILGYMDCTPPEKGATC